MDTNHGRHSFTGKDKLCTFESLTAGRFGRFGRLFPHLKPLYISPNILTELGKVGGPMDSGNTAQFTNTPLGMIFLGQFIDHDITFDTDSSFNSLNIPDIISNIRTPTLDLDCVFGNGPEDEPFMYVDENTDLRLLNGFTNNNQGQGTNIEKHDLARNGKGRAIIGDPRNDENRIISQLQLAFIQFYNAEYKRLEDEDKQRNDPLPVNLQKRKSAEALHLEARQHVTWHYQWIVVTEFLPLLCGKEIMKKVLGQGRKFYTPREAFIPVEFSVAAYRFGHSMIAQHIKLQPGGQEHNLFSPGIGRGFTPITNLNQVVDWKAFFDIDNTHQKAERLDIKLASDLLNLPFVHSNDPGDKSLATRNLRRAQSFLLPSGEEVARAMGRPEAEIDRMISTIKGLTEPAGIDLSAGTPLWFYILAEAGEIGRLDAAESATAGEGLGPVGATIVAEVIIGLLELDQRSFLGSNRDWKPFLGTNGQFTMKDMVSIAASV